MCAESVVESHHDWPNPASARALVAAGYAVAGVEWDGREGRGKGGRGGEEGAERGGGWGGGEGAERGKGGGHKTPELFGERDHHDEAERSADPSSPATFQQGGGSTRGEDGLAVLLVLRTHDREMDDDSARRLVARIEGGGEASPPTRVVTLRLEGHSATTFEAQVRAVAAAQVVVSTHGAFETNMMWLGGTHAERNGTSDARRYAKGETGSAGANTVIGGIRGPDKHNAVTSARQSPHRHR